MKAEPEYPEDVAPSEDELDEYYFPEDPDIDNKAKLVFTDDELDYTVEKDPVREEKK